MIKFDNVSKKFNLHKEHQARSFHEVVTGLFRRRSHPHDEYAWILRDVSFTIEPGETVGIIGRNGAGKSTLLKLMSHIILPNTGRIQIDGRVSSLLELGAGFHPDLTGRENIFLYGAVLGLPRQRIRQKFNEIVDFAELATFIDVPVRHYSSGMYLRLAFSTAIHVEPDILLIDEAFAVGDQLFQQRCLRQIAALMEAGVTVVLVSHDADVIRQYCRRAIWLDSGKLRADGETEWAIEIYLQNLYTTHYNPAAQQIELPQRLASPIEIDQHRQAGQIINRWGSGEVEIIGVEFVDAAGEKQTTFTTGQMMVTRILYRANQRVENPVFGTAIYRNDGLHINGPNTKVADYAIPVIEGPGCLEFTIEQLNLLPGIYDFSAVVYDETTTQAFDHQHRLYNFVVRAGQVQETHGAFYLPSRWEHYPESSLDLAQAIAAIDSSI